METKEETKEKLYSNTDLRKLILPLVIEQLLAVLVGMLDTVMISGEGEAAEAGSGRKSSMANGIVYDLLILCYHDDSAAGAQNDFAAYLWAGG